MSNIVVLISGNGSNLQAIIDSVQNGAIDGCVSAVISNKPDVYGLERAEKAGIPAIAVDHSQFSSRSDFEQALIQTIDQYQPNLVVLAGFMRILSSEFVQHYLGTMLNIHPSLLPKYPGLNTHKRVLENGDKEHGTSVHFVTAELDGGPIIAQRSFHVTADDNEESLQKKIQQQEHKLYPEVVSWFCSGRLQFKDGKAWLDQQPVSIL
ncbi:phosphoribosylglycinamide formyltransferase [Kangiella koreensis]|uniref:Phosphoribosylglycinamide formyltransferase n=1 Tax=Kangiella koreensis (strain DSM 16069 / JCM 12317 / KCTC 12182 / SW-125) TaxID=523791 RepID=C7RCV7_KANKD|nr:phosphoribosylglycinamide formyltransferase [Kangiella koreensis]ACV27099.1 phosphoribosylglycinamide formyltransferase [Kangiella koreensis DSM 16069]